jgi:hypothetical protein
MTLHGNYRDQARNVRQDARARLIALRNERRQKRNAVFEPMPSSLRELPAGSSRCNPVDV